MTKLNYQIKTNKIETACNKPHFYIQNKGLNSGKPLNNPIPNCFLLSTETEEQRDSLFYLCQSLQIGQFFSYYIVGSVIPFLRIDDAKKVLNTAIQNYKKDQWELKVEKLKKITIYENNLKQQLSLISQLKTSFLRS